MTPAEEEQRERALIGMLDAVGRDFREQLDRNFSRIITEGSSVLRITDDGLDFVEGDSIQLRQENGCINRDVLINGQAVVRAADYIGNSRVRIQPGDIITFHRGNQFDRAREIVPVGPGMGDRWFDLIDSDHDLEEFLMKCDQYLETIKYYERLKNETFRDSQDGE